MITTLWIRFKELRFLQLILYILLFTILIPFFDYDWLARLFSAIFLLNALLVSLSTGAQPWRYRTLLWILLGTSVLFTALALFQPDPAQRLRYLRWGIKVDIVLLFLCLAAILRYIFSSRYITLDHIFALVVAYLILALIFAQFYGLLFFYQPQSFNLSTPLVQTSLSFLHGSFMYYSIMVITTVGMGDILPLTPVGRVLTMVEAITGQFFVAVLVAWLVGRFIAHEANQPPPPD